MGTFLLKTTIREEKKNLEEEAHDDVPQSFSILRNNYFRKQIKQQDLHDHLRSAVTRNLSRIGRVSVTS
jgi:hypothetical protein